MRKWIIILVVVAAVAAGGVYWFFGREGATASASPTPASAE
jgi:flagellar basal body-associated protein FliL